MLDIKWIREHQDELALMLEQRNNTFPLDRFIELDRVRRNILLEVEALKKREMPAQSK